MMHQTETAGQDNVTASEPQSRSPLKFFLLVFALSIPIWLVGTLTEFQLLEGLPFSTLMTFHPLIAAVLFHAAINVANFMFPNLGSHYDPRIAGLVTAFIAIFVAIVWGPRTLARNRNV